MIVLFYLEDDDPLVFPRFIPTAKLETHGQPRRPSGGWTPFRSFFSLICTSQNNQENVAIAAAIPPKSIFEEDHFHENLPASILKGSDDDGNAMMLAEGDDAFCKSGKFSLYLSQTKVQLKSILRKESQFDKDPRLKQGPSQYADADIVVGNYSRTLPRHLARRFGMSSTIHSGSDESSASEDDCHVNGPVDLASTGFSQSHLEHSSYAVLEELLGVDVARNDDITLEKDSFSSNTETFLDQPDIFLNKPFLDKTNILNLKKHLKQVTFSNSVLIGSAISSSEYDRKCASDMAAKNLTPELAHQIKKELNLIKKEMKVHEGAKGMTQFYTL